MRVHECFCGCGEKIIEEDQNHFKKFVNNAHRQQNYRNRKKIERNAQRVTGIRKRCLNCGVEFLGRTARHVFHSDSCRVSYWQQQQRFKDTETQ